MNTLGRYVIPLNLNPKTINFTKPMQIGRLIYDCELYEYVCSIAAAQSCFQKETSDKTEISY